MILLRRKLRKKNVTFIIFIFIISCAVQKNKSYNLINTDKLQGLIKSNKKIGIIVPLNSGLPLFKLDKPSRKQRISSEKKCPNIPLLVIFVIVIVLKSLVQIEESGDLVTTPSILEGIDYKKIKLIYMLSDLPYDNLIISGNKVYNSKQVLIKNFEYVDGNIRTKKNKNKVYQELPVLEGYDYFVKFRYELGLSEPKNIGYWYNKFCSLTFDIIPHANKYDLKCYLDVLDKRGILIKSFENVFSYKTYRWLTPLINREKISMMNDWDEQKEIMMKNLLKAILKELNQYGDLVKRTNVENNSHTQ